jgi:hypothetical protein
MSKAKERIGAPVSRVFTSWGINMTQKLTESQVSWLKANVRFFEEWPTNPQQKGAIPMMQINSSPAVIACTKPSTSFPDTAGSLRALSNELEGK